MPPDATANVYEIANAAVFAAPKQEVIFQRARVCVSVLCICEGLCVYMCVGFYDP